MLHTDTEGWTASQWQRVLAAAWPMLQAALGDRAPVWNAAVFTQLRALSRARSQESRARIGVELRALLEQDPALEAAVVAVISLPQDPAETPGDIVDSAPATEPAPTIEPAPIEPAPIEPGPLEVSPGEPWSSCDEQSSEGWYVDTTDTTGVTPIDDVLPTQPVTPPPSAPHLEPDSSAEHTPAQEAPPIPDQAHRFITVPVWLMTDRTPQPHDDPRQRFTTERSGELHLGKAQVTIPDLHRKGRLERPAKILWTFELREDRSKHLTLADVTELDEAAWIDDLRGAVAGPAEDTVRDVLVFVHGYATSFQGSLLRAAQLGRDVEFQGPIVAYSWSSKGRKLAYLQDAEAVDATETVLRRALTLLLEHSGARRVHIVAHSMGNRAVVGALEKLANTRFPAGSADLRELVFAAPDVGTSVFTDFVEAYYADALHATINASTGTPSRLTLYACGDDDALGLSNALQDMTRAGDARQQLVVRPPLETVDVTRAIVSRDRHGYFTSNRDVLTDLFGLLRGAAATDRPNLDPRSHDAGEYWEMRA